MLGINISVIGYDIGTSPQIVTSNKKHIKPTIKITQKEIKMLLMSK